MSQTAAVPLLSSSSDAPIAWRAARTVSSQTFLAHVRRVAERLPNRAFAINLCEDRYLFLVAFAAAGVRGQSNLLPSSRVAGAIRETAEQYPDCHRIGDEDVQAWLGDEPIEGVQEMPHIPAGHVMAIPFTSGTTGCSRAHPKRWGDLVTGARLAERRFGFAAGRSTIVATVPPQHMYGLETSIMLPLALGVGVYAGRSPFFPDDIRSALAAIPAPRLLVTTPAHLRVCVSTNVRWPPVAKVISATAPLSVELAAAAERAFMAPVMEIYGFTEAGSVASRRTVSDALWMLYDGIHIEQGAFSARHLPCPVRPDDILDIRSSTQFALAGRRQELVNVAGKRTSLSYLNQLLNEIAGVEDGAFVVPDGEEERPQRLLALVVARETSKRRILAELARRIDPIFLPRPLVMVERLPRNETGKLRRDAVRELLKSANHPARTIDEG
jgi:acyl-coenzyme A synthetase/AMP-(fatty) acid ligase